MNLSKFITYASLGLLVIHPYFLGASGAMPGMPSLPQMPGSNQNANPLLDIKPEELDKLNISPKELEEFTKFMEELNKMPQEEKDAFAQAMAELDQALEKEMKEKGVDPNNLEEVSKFLESQLGDIFQSPEGMKPFEPEMPLDKKPAQPSYQAPVISKPIAVKSPARTQEILDGLIRTLGKIRQKAVADQTLSHMIERWNLELNQFIYYLHILNQDDLIAHLASKEFTHLYDNLDKLYETIQQQEPRIDFKKSTQIDSNDPYEILDIAYHATPEEITQAFDALKQTNSPQAIEELLKAEKDLSKKEKNKYIKEAAISFQFIEDAYELLNDPKQRQQIDKQLKEKIEQEKNSFKTAQAALVKVGESISALYQQNVIADIQKLLEKYRPEELARAKAQEESEKKAVERSKTHGKTTLNYSGNRPQKEPYREFYEHVRQENIERQLSMPYFPQGSEYSAPSTYDTNLMNAPSRKESTPSEKSKDGSSKGGEKGGKEGKEASEKEGKESGGKKSKSGEEKAKSPDFELASLINDASSNLSKLKDACTPVKTRSRLAGAAEESALDQIARDLGTYLETGILDDTAREALNKLKELYEKAGLKDAWKAVNLIALNKNLSQPDIAKVWNDKMKDAYKFIQQVDDKLYVLLSPVERANRSRPAINNVLFTRHKFVIPTEELKSKQDVDKRFKEISNDLDAEVDEMNFGTYAQVIHQTRTLMDKISKETKLELPAEKKPAQQPGSAAAEPAKPEDLDLPVE